MKYPPILISAILSTLFIGFTAGAAAEPPAPIFHKLKAGQKQTVVAYGTSLTATGEWVQATQQWFDAKYPDKVKVINSGGPGQNSDWGVQNLQKKVLAAKPDLVFIEFSYNDAKTKFNMPAARAGENLRTMIEAIRSQNPETAIVLQTMNPGWDPPNGNQNASIRPDLEHYYDAYRKAAHEQNLPLIDHYPNWKKLEKDDSGTFKKYIPDGSHPTAEGSLAVTWPGIQEWLEKAQASSTP